MSNSLFLLRGAAGSGKSSWIVSNHLEEYTISPDKLRVSMLGIDYDEEGNPHVPQTSQWVIWRQINQYVEDRMNSREPIIILDATNLYTKHMKKYRSMANRNDYHVYVVDFTDVPKEYCYQQNMEKGYAKVPEYVIDKFYALYPYNLPPDGFLTITRDEALQIINSELSKEPEGDKYDERGLAMG